MDGIARIVVAGAVLAALAIAGCSKENTMTTASAKPAAQLVHNDGKTFIAGMDQLAWPPEQTNSVMRTAAIAMQTAGHKQYTYQYLMGATGLAFRFQTHKEGWCPSSPHACCGQPAAQRLSTLLPYQSIEYPGFWERHKDEPSLVAAVHKDIRASIDRGIPVPFGSEENGLIVGYTDDGKLLGRGYGDRGAPGFKEIARVPWGYNPWGKPQQPPSPRQVAIESLKTAVMLAHAQRINGYDEGLYALTNYVARLRDAKAYEDPDESKRPGHLGNAFIYECLCDARSQAGGYLASIRGDLGQKAAAELDLAAALYRQIAAKLADPCPVTVAPYPWMKDRPWTQELRNRQADIMEACIPLERQAVSHLEAALMAEGVDVAPLKAPVVLVTGQRVKPCANWMTMPGCMVRSAEAMGIYSTPQWVFGASGLAFALNIHDELCPSGPTAWQDHKSYPLLANAGLKIRPGFASKRSPDFAANQAKVVELIRETVAAGRPAVVWEMDVPDWYVVCGYEGDDLLFLDFGGAMRRLPASKLGDTGIGLALALSAERCDKADLHKTLSDVVTFALDNAAGKHRHGTYRAGLEAYDAWIAAIENYGAGSPDGATHGFGAAYNAACWSECRRMAAAFLKDAAGQTNDADLAKALAAAAGHYQKVADSLTAVGKLLPFDPKDQPGMAARFAEAPRRAKAVAELRAAKTAEADGLGALKEVGALLGLLKSVRAEAAPVYYEDDEPASFDWLVHITNDGSQPATMSLKSDAPKGLTVEPAQMQVEVPAGQTKPVRFALKPQSPGAVKDGSLKLEWSAVGTLAGGASRQFSGRCESIICRRYVCPQSDGSPQANMLPATRPALVLLDASKHAGQKDCSFRVGVCHTAGRVRIVVDVTDDVLYCDPGKAVWSQDGVEIRLDARPDPARSACRGEGEWDSFLPIGISPGEADGEMTIWNRDRWPKGTQASCRRTESGYRVEVSVPAEYLDKAQGGPWKDFRLNVAVNDYDKPTTGAQLWWQPDWRHGTNIPGSGTFRRAD